jgi:hypothetical protein
MSKREKCKSGSRCHPAITFQDSSPMAAIDSSAEDKKAGR